MLLELSRCVNTDRVIEWYFSKPRKSANVAFTEGNERTAAYWIEWAEAKERWRCAQVVRSWELIPGHSAAGEIAYDMVAAEFGQIADAIEGNGDD